MAADVSSIGLDLLSHHEAVHRGHLGIEQYQLEGCSCVARLFHGGQSGGPASGQRWPQAPVPQHVFQNLPVRGVVVDDQHGQIVPLFGHAAPRWRRFLRQAEARRKVKRAAVPNSLSTQISPPIIATSFETMARPRPVPP